MCSDRNLIISYDTYSWIEYCTGLILSEPAFYELIVVCKDDKDRIFECIDLCPEAVYEQRANDLYRVGTELKLKKVSNLLLDEDELDIYKLTMQLQLLLLLGNYKNVYVQYNNVLRSIITSIKDKCSSNLYFYNNTLATKNQESITITLQNNLLREKERMLDMIVGCKRPSISYSANPIEYFYKIN